METHHVNVWIESRETDFRFATTQGLFNLFMSAKPVIRLIASDKSWIEGAAVQQLEKTAELPGMVAAVGMPDLHPGKSYPIGAAFATRDVLYPALVGNDIGCGMGVWQTNLPRRKAKRDAWAAKLTELEGPWGGETEQWLTAYGVEPTGFDHSLGTIGSGNHFAELQQFEAVADEETLNALGFDRGQVQLLVHSGSRGFGEAVLRRHLDLVGGSGVAAGTEAAGQYLTQHAQAVRWAVANRALIARRLLDCLRVEGELRFDICHNSVTQAIVAGCSCWLHRKGVAPSTEGVAIIPGSRGALTYLVQPAGDQEMALFSLAHGAGRKWNRGETRARMKAKYRVESLATTDLGSTVICEDKDLLFEEAPPAYKNIDAVVNDLVAAGLVRIIATLRPILTYKVRAGMR
jgi:release factor H-coupled RctB family protein